MKIGTLTPLGNELHGTIQTLQIKLKLKLVPNMQRLSDRAPDYQILVPSDDGIEPIIGVAWKKSKQHIGDVVLEFLSITIDDPSLPNSLNVAAFKNGDGGYEITWRRRQISQNDAVQNAG